MVGDFAYLIFLTLACFPQIGDVTLPLPAGWSSNGVKALDYRVKLSMQFGRTELTVTAVNVQTGHSVQASLKFEHSNLAI